MDEAERPLWRPYLQLQHEVANSYSESAQNRGADDALTGLLNKNQQNGDVAVHYHKGLLDAPADKIADRWTVEMSGEVTSTQPPSN